MSKVRWACTSRWEKSKKSRRLIYIMLTLTNSYWCFFINESDTAQAARRGIPIERWNEIMPKFGNGMNPINLFEASLLFSPDAMGGRMNCWDVFMQLWGTLSQLKSASVLPLLKGRLGRNMDEENRNRAAGCVRKRELWQRRNSSSLCCPITVDVSPPTAPALLLSAVLVPFLCSVLFSSALVVAQKCGSNLHARPQGRGQCVCPVTLQWLPSKGHHSP